MSERSEQHGAFFDAQRRSRASARTDGAPVSGSTGDEAGDPIRQAVLEAFVEVSADALICQDAAGRIVAWNRSAERIFGRHAEDVIGTPIRDLFPDHVRDDVGVLLDTVADGARVDHVETEVARRDGMRIPISVSLRPVCDATGSCCGVVGVARDLTEQRLTQSALAETEARLRDAEALAHAGRWLWDVASGAVQWSEEMHRINGVDPATFEGTLDAHLARVHPDDVDALRAAFETAVATRRPFDVEYRIQHDDGADRWLYSRAEPTFGSIGAVVGLRGFAQDITDRHDAGSTALIAIED